jgi:translation elongation factor EF-Ts
MRTEIERILKLKKKSLNIHDNEKRLILLAIIHSNYNLRKAYKLNNPNWLTFESYVKKVSRYGVKMQDLKKIVEQIRKDDKKVSVK